MQQRLHRYKHLKGQAAELKLWPQEVLGSVSTRRKGLRWWFQWFCMILLWIVMQVTSNHPMSQWFIVNFPFCFLPGIADTNCGWLADSPRNHHHSKTVTVGHGLGICETIVTIVTDIDRSCVIFVSYFCHISVIFKYLIPKYLQGCKKNRRNQRRK